MDDPNGVATLTPTVPEFVGAVAVISFGVTTVKLEEGFGPKLTALAPPSPLPKIVTMVPPPADTVLGETEVTTGAPGTGTVEVGIDGSGAVTECRRV